MPTLREIVAGYEAANAWELEEEKERLPTLTIHTLKWISGRREGGTGTGEV